MAADYPQVEECAWRVAFFIRKANSKDRAQEAKAIMTRLIGSNPTNVEYAQTLYHLHYDDDEVWDAARVVQNFLLHADAEIFRELRDGLIEAGFWPPHDRA